MAGGRPSNDGRFTTHSGPSRASKGVVGALLINAGNANCATRNGEKVANNTTKALAKLLKLPPTQVLPASTGVIGVELDENLILSKLETLVTLPSVYALLWANSNLSTKLTLSTVLFAGRMYPPFPP